MPSFAVIPENNREATDTLKRYYDSLNWFYKLFFPSRMKAFLDRYPINDPERVNLNRASYLDLLNLHRAFLQSSSFVRWLFSGLTRFASAPTVLALQSRRTLIDGDVGDLNFQAILQHPYPERLALCLEKLTNSGILTPVTRAHCFETNTEARMVSLSDALALTSNDKWPAFRTIEEKQAHFFLLKDHSNPKMLAEAMNVLAGHNLNHSSYPEACSQSSDPVSLATNICRLDSNDILTNDNLQLIQQYPSSHNQQNSCDIITTTLITLYLAGLDTSENGINCSKLNPYDLVIFNEHLGNFLGKRLLTQKVFDYLYNNQEFFTNFSNEIWNRISEDTLREAIENSEQTLDLLSLYPNAIQQGAKVIYVDSDYSDEESHSAAALFTQLS